MRVASHGDLPSVALRLDLGVLRFPPECCQSAHRQSAHGQKRAFGGSNETASAGWTSIAPTSARDATTDFMQKWEPVGLKRHVDPRPRSSQVKDMGLRCSARGHAYASLSAGTAGVRKRRSDRTDELTSTAPGRRLWPRAGRTRTALLHSGRRHHGGPFHWRQFHLVHYHVSVARTSRGSGTTLARRWFLAARLSLAGEVRPELGGRSQAELAETMIKLVVAAMLSLAPIAAQARTWWIVSSDGGRYHCLDTQDFQEDSNKFGPGAVTPEQLMIALRSEGMAPSVEIEKNPDDGSPIDIVSWVNPFGTGVGRTFYATPASCASGLAVFAGMTPPPNDLR